MIRDLVEAIRREDADAVRRLLGEDPGLVAATDPDSFGATPLIHAVNAGSRELVDVLLAAGADVDQRSDWWAGSFGVLDDGSDEMATYLLARGATLTPHAAARLGKLDELRGTLDEDPSRVHARGGDGQLPLHFARTTEIADLLLARGAEIDARDVDHESTAAQWLATSRPEVAARLVERGCAVDPFLLAAIGDLEGLGRLLESEADGVRVRVDRRRFPTSERAAGHIYLYTIGEGCGLLHFAAVLDRADVVRFLLAAGADVDARGGYDDATPLHQAAWHDRVEAARALLAGGADPDLPSGRIHHNEPLGWAVVSGAAGVAAVLLEHGCRVRDVHRQDAVAGVRGAFRQFQRARPPAAWERIEELLR